MAVIPMVRITNPLAEYSDNLLNYNSTFNDDLVFSVTTGSGIANCNNQHYFQGGKALKVTNYSNVPMTFGTAANLGFTATQTGQYILSLRLFIEQANGDDPSFVINLFRNGVLFNQYTMIYMEQPFLNGWSLFSQTMILNASDVITFSFEFNPAFVNDSIWVDGLKCELDDRTSGIPTAYTMPKDYCCNDLNKNTGWAQYKDTVFTSGSPFTVSSGVTSTLPCNAGSKIETQLPTGYDMLFNSATNKLKAFNSDDKYLLNVRFKAKTSVTNDFLTIGIDIGGTQNIIVSEDVLFTRGANVEQTFNIILTYFTRSTFLSNGGLIKITAKNGNIQIYDITIIPELTHKAI